MNLWTYKIKVNRLIFGKTLDQAELLKELQRIRLLRDQYLYITSTQKELPELIELFRDDQIELAKLKTETRELSRTVRKFKITLLLSDPQDNSNCFFSINAGAGGTESQDWAEMLLRMYVRFCEQSDFAVDVVDYQTGEAAGIKSATLFIKGKNAYGLLKGEQGIHRLVRISPYDANKRRHTSFAAVSITPEVPEVAIISTPRIYALTPIVLAAQVDNMLIKLNLLFASLISPVAL